MPLPGAVPSVLRPAVRRLLLPGSASGPRLLARTIYADASGKLVLPTEARTTTGYAKNSDGVYEAFGSGVPLIVGARKDGSDYYATDGGGSPLDPAPYVLTCPGATNSCAYSQDFSQTGWSAINASRAADLVDIFGNTNSAQTLTDTSAAGFGRYFYDASISSSANEHSARFWISYDASPSSYPALDITIFLGGTPVPVTYIIDPSDGSSVGSGSATRKISVTRDGDFWRCTVSLTDNDSGNTVMRVSIYPSYSADGSTPDSSLTGSCGADQAEIFLNTAHDVAHALPPIPTSGSSEMIGITKVNEAIQPTSNFVLKFHWTPEYDDQGTVYLIGNYTDANNAWAVLHDGTNIIFRNRVSGTDNDATKALNYVVGTEYEITIWHDDATGLHIGVDDIEGTLDSTTTDVTSAAATYFGQDGNNANAGINGIRDVRYWEGRASSWSQVTGLTA